MNEEYHSPVRRQLKQWPHAGPLQSGLAWTIASLCWSIPRSFLARQRQADHGLSHILPSSPACLRSAGAQIAYDITGRSIKSRTVWKDLQNGIEIATQCFDTGTPFPPSLVVFRSIQHSSLACGTGACEWQSWQLSMMTSCVKWHKETMKLFTT